MRYQGRVLVIDDEIELMNVIVEALETRGFKVTGLTSAIEGLEMLCRQKFDLLLVDMMIPEMNGIELLKRALTIDPYIAGIIITGYGTVQTAVKAMKMGAFDFVLKPFNIDVLVSALNRALDFRQLRQENAQLRESMAVYESEDRFYKIFHYSPDLIAIIREKDHKYLDVNPMYLETLEYSRDELIGRTPEELGILPDAQIVDLLSKGGKNIEINFKAKSGHIITALSSLVKINLNGEICILIIAKDITEKKHYEQEITRLDRLNLVGEMAASIGHELRNPMTSIRGFLQMLRDKHECMPYQEYYDLMIEELDRANQIISEFLNLAKGKPLDLKPHYLPVIIKSLYPMIRADAYYSDKQVRLDLDCPVRAILDEKEIRQLILNMARNGLEAMQAGGTLTIGARVIQNCPVLYIKDEGSGLDESLLSRLGTPFVTTKENGIGLGLAVCYSIAARHKARIEVDTSPQGTTFCVYFPNSLESITLFS